MRFGKLGIHFILREATLTWRIIGRDLCATLVPGMLFIVAAWNNHAPLRAANSPSAVRIACRRTPGSPHLYDFYVLGLYGGWKRNFRNLTFTMGK